MALCCLMAVSWADTPAADSPALTFAKRDAQRASEAATAATNLVAEAVTKLQAVEKAIADATAAKETAAKIVVDAGAALQSTETAKLAADQAVLDTAANAQKVKDDAAADQAAKEKAQLDVTAAQAAATTAAEAVKIKQTEKTTADVNLVNAGKGLELAQAGLKPAQDAKTIVEKDLAPLAVLAKAAQEKATFYAATPPVAQPEAIRLIQTFKHTRPFQSCRIDPTGDFVFGGCQDNTIQRWDLVLSKQIPMPGHKSWVADFDFQPGTNLLLSAAYEGKLLWWETPLGSPNSARTVAAHRGQIRSIACSPDGQFLATAGNDKLVRIWRTADGALLKELAGHGSHIYHVAFHPNGKHLVSGELLGILKQWEVATWQHVRDLDAKPLHKYDPTFHADCGGIRGMAFSPDGRFLAAGGIGEVTNAFAGVGKPTVLIYDWLTGQRMHLLNPKSNFQGSVWSLQFHPTRDFLIGAGGGGSGGLWFWNAEAGTALFDFPLPAAAYDLSIHPDGMRLALACFDNTVKIYDLGPKSPEPAPAK
jgi:WD40 repeat protein